MYELNSKAEKRQFFHMVLALVLPMTLQNFINVCVSSNDVIMLGKVGEVALSASSLAGQVPFIMTLIFFGVTSGAAVLTSQYWGKKDIRSIEKVIGISMRITLCVAAVFTVLAIGFPGLIMRIFTTEEPVIEAGISYLRIAGFSYIFIGITMVYLNIMRSVERVVISTVVYTISLVIDIALSAVLIFGLLGFPAMGIRGAALATLIARIVELIVVAFYATRINRQVVFHLKDLFVRDKLLTKDFVTYAFPVLLNELLWGMGISAVAAIIGHMGSAMVAANSVAQVVRQLAMIVVFGMANATAIVIGKTIGEGKTDFAKVYGGRFVKWSLILGIVGAGVILLVSPIARANLELSTQAKSYLEMMLIVMAVYVVAQSYNATVIVGVFRGGGDTRVGLIIDIVSLWGIAIMIGWLAAFVWKLPPAIIYMILTCDEITKIPMSFWRYRQYKWLKNVTR